MLGYKITITSNKQTEYKDIPNSPFGIPVTSLQDTFKSCSNLVSPPTIPDTVVEIQNCFRNCRKMTEAPILGDNISNMAFAFTNCENLVDFPNIPKDVMRNAYVGNKLSSIIPKMGVHEFLTKLKEDAERMSDEDLEVYTLSMPPVDLIDK